MVTNKDIAAKFRAAKKTLPYHDNDRDKSPFICDNLLDSGGPAAREAKDIISERLGGCWSIEDWLVDNGYIPERLAHQKYSKDTQDLIQAYRHRWLDALIAEFENKPD